MKIWCDIRFLYDQSAYAFFVSDLLAEYISQRRDVTFFLYSNESVDIVGGNVVSRVIKEGRDGILDEFRFSRELKKDELDIFLAFDENKPFFYKGKTIQFIPSLAHIFYADDTRASLKKSWENYTYNKNLKIAHKIVCFDESTKDDLNERFNIKEEKIVVLKPFFVLDDLLQPSDIVKIDIKSRHNLGMDYLIYNAGYGVDKNLERLIEVLSRLREVGRDVALFVLWAEEIGIDLDVRKIVLDLNLNDRVFFHASIKKEEEAFFFQQSLWVVYPVLYESFPFTLNKALFYNTPIIASHISSVKEIFHDSIDYFNPVSKVDMTKSIMEFIRKNITVDYTQVKLRYSKAGFIESLQSILK